MWKFVNVLNVFAFVLCVVVLVFRCVQMLECLKGVHSCGYLHRDVKPANFVRRKKNGKDFVIIDFGESWRNCQCVP